MEQQERERQERERQERERQERDRQAAAGQETPGLQYSPGLVVPHSSVFFSGKFVAPALQFLKLT